MPLAIYEAYMARKENQQKHTHDDGPAHEEAVLAQMKLKNETPTEEPQSAQVVDIFPMLHPNPKPRPYPHFSSLECLRKYIDDQGEQYRREVLETKLEHSHAEDKCCCKQASSEQSSVERTASSSCRAKLPRSQARPPHFQPLTPPQRKPSEPNSRPCNITDASLAPSTKAAIEAYIPTTILRLPLYYRIFALRAWYDYLCAAEPVQTQLPPQRTRKRAVGAVVTPWDTGLERWRGSLKSWASEVDRIKEEREVEGQSLDVLEGNVLGRDWACGREGKTILVYRRSEEEGKVVKVVKVVKVAKDSVFERMAGGFKRALS
ncbi:hypothetical protein BU23DRAFT_566685 [Bimuria novae-zelandiae CBS 107.79]|uniref:Uncharacterized protein n=1 Tax=Bimuria novae-zelandiae CBS 107.79 TaxID=1447943 RepID=A0A6A5VGQ3_9PLEO|nr:hypothetical protein BU23DRAFT_566685 [Bimuria novae-zelandiae CBS 107.79]